MGQMGCIVSYKRFWPMLEEALISDIIEALNNEKKISGLE
jgi:hypothetical protein